MLLSIDARVGADCCYRCTKVADKKIVFFKVHIDEELKGICLPKFEDNNRFLSTRSINNPFLIHIIRKHDIDLVSVLLDNLKL